MPCIWEASAASISALCASHPPFMGPAYLADMPADLSSASMAKNVYHAGDTALFGDMALLGRLESIDVALLPIGDNFTMGPQDAAEAAHLLKPQLVIPMHYNTWPVIAQEPDSFKQDVETRFSIPVRVMQAGDEFSL